MAEKVFQESVLKDIADIAAGVYKSGGLQGRLSKYNIRSISATSAKLTAIFHVLASTAVDPKTAMLVSKAFEKKCTAMMQMLVSAINVTDADDAIDYLKTFHTNMKFDSTDEIDDYMTTMAKFDDDYDPAFFESGNIIKSYDNHTDTLDQFAKVVYENYINDLYTSTTIPTEQEFRDSLSDVKIYKTDSVTHPYVASMSIHEETLRGNHREGRLGEKEKVSDMLKAQTDFHKKQVISDDYKKANEMMPTLLMVRFFSKDCNIPTTAVIGIKSKLVPVDSSEIVNHIASKRRDDNFLFNLIKATTSEIGFFRDLIFALDKAKLDALEYKNRGPSMWRTLERMSTISKLNRNLGIVNTATATTLMLISKEEADYLLKNDGVNLASGSVAYSIMTGYNLMGLAIADESAEQVSFLFDDGDKKYETISFSHLKSNGDNGSEKKIVNLLSRVGK